jgi:hypothetical protein
MKLGSQVVPIPRHLRRVGVLLFIQKFSILNSLFLILNSNEFVARNRPWY